MTDERLNSLESRIDEVESYANVAIGRLGDSLENWIRRLEDRIGNLEYDLNRAQRAAERAQEIAESARRGW